jgi:hypothetical protein
MRIRIVHVYWLLTAVIIAKALDLCVVPMPWLLLAWPFVMPVLVYVAAIMGSIWIALQGRRAACDRMQAGWIDE